MRGLNDIIVMNRNAEAEEKSRKEQKGEHIDLGDLRLHIYRDGPDFTSPWKVWLNTRVASFDGLCIGWGKTRVMAIVEAKRTLAEALEKLG